MVLCVYIYTCIYKSINKSVKKEKGGGKPQEERKAVLSEEKNEEEITMMRLKDLKLQVKNSISYYLQSAGVILEQ